MGERDHCDLCGADVSYLDDILTQVNQMRLEGHAPKYLVAGTSLSQGVDEEFNWFLTIPISAIKLKFYGLSVEGEPRRSDATESPACFEILP